MIVYVDTFTIIYRFIYVSAYNNKAKRLDKFAYISFETYAPWVNFKTGALFRTSNL